jgi:hypothetical protein
VADKDNSIYIVVGLLLAGGAAIFFFFVPTAAAGDTTGTDTSGGDTSSQPPSDFVNNPEVGDVTSGDTSMLVTPDKVLKLATAIATAEGFYSSNPNVIPRRGNNPGDLTASFGLPTSGKLNSAGVLQFDSADAGWTALKMQATLMLNGQSHNYRPTMTLYQVAAKYTGGDNASSWAQNAASVLGISPDNTLADFLGMP